MLKRQLLIEKFERNKKLAFEFRNNYKYYLDLFEMWEQPAFFNASFSNRQYFNELVRVSDLEYSDMQSDAIKSNRYSGTFFG
jgi:hypothetical protein